MKFEFVYVIAAPDGRTKVGYTRSVKQRLSGLISSTGLNLEVAAVYLAEENEGRLAENQIHRLFSNYQTVGEWFAISPATAIEHIDQVRDSLKIIPYDLSKGLPPASTLRKSEPKVAVSLRIPRSAASKRTAGWSIRAEKFLTAFVQHPDYPNVSEEEIERMRRAPMDPLP